MNYFILDHDPENCARYHDNCRVNKMAIETAQMLSTAIRHVTGYTGTDISKSTHAYHPVSMWTRSGGVPFLKLSRVGIALCDEYTRRYKKEHASRCVIERCIELYYPGMFPDYLPEYALAMPDEFKDPYDVVNSYRRYFASKRLVRYDIDDIPEWFSEIRKLPFFVAKKVDKRGKRVYTECVFNDGRLVEVNDECNHDRK